MTGQLEQVDASIASALRVLSVVDEPDCSSPGNIAAGLAAVMRARLGPSERLTIASAAMLSLDAEQAEMLAEAALHDLRAGAPLPPFMGVQHEAQEWASFASPAERKWYLVACWNALPERDRQAFMRRAA